MYDVLILGGGMAGLSLAIQLASNGKSILVCEQNSYPFQKVCGEYLSKESLPFLHFLGVNLYEMGAIDIDELQLGSVWGQKVVAKLPLGGLGFSRFNLDYLLMQRAKELGVVVLEKCKVRNTLRLKDRVQWETTLGIFEGRVGVIGSGKHAAIESKNREFSKKTSPWVGVKYHVKHPHERNKINLQIFPKGYAGFSAIENGKSCFCYLVHKEALKGLKGYQELEKKILSKNPVLNTFMEEAEMLTEATLVHGIGFGFKEVYENGHFFVGDAVAGIPPLSGNGMSMALHGSLHLASALQGYFEGKWGFETAILSYKKNLSSSFKTRVVLGGWIQQLFNGGLESELLLALVRIFPYIKPKIIALTHGKAFYPK